MVIRQRKKLEDRINFHFPLHSTFFSSSLSDALFLESSTGTTSSRRSLKVVRSPDLRQAARPVWQTWVRSSCHQIPEGLHNSVGRRLPPVWPASPSPAPCLPSPQNSRRQSPNALVSAWQSPRISWEPFPPGAACPLPHNRPLLVTSGPAYLPATGPTCGGSLCALSKQSPASSFLP